ncbi:MAG: glutamate ligase domain-containing protein, partial [Porticoccaceae bacterium]
FRGASKVVINREDQLTKPLLSSQVTQTSFGLNQPDLGEFGILEGLEQGYLARGIERLMPISEVAIKGTHNLANALAALALGFAAGLPLQAMREALKTYRGLPHRCENVAEIDGVLYIDDSKGTNVGATEAALEGFGSAERKNLILIAGGLGKDQDFTGLQSTAAKYVKQALLFGQDAQQIDRALGSVCDTQCLDSLQSAVEQAALMANAGDIVLLSPACASFDMFSGFEERGRCFQQAVANLPGAQQAESGGQLCS